MNEFNYNIKTIKSLKLFVSYCEIINKENDKDDSNTSEWKMDELYYSIMETCQIYKDYNHINYDTFLKTVSSTFVIYNNWIKKAELKEEYESCKTIEQALRIEQKHFTILGKKMFAEEEELEETVQFIYEEAKRAVLNPEE